MPDPKPRGELIIDNKFEILTGDELNEVRESLGNLPFMSEVKKMPIARVAGSRRYWYPAGDWSCDWTSREVHEIEKRRKQLDGKDPDEEEKRKIYELVLSKQLAVMCDKIPEFDRFLDHYNIPQERVLGLGLSGSVYFIVIRTSDEEVRHAGQVGRILAFDSLDGKETHLMADYDYRGLRRLGVNITDSGTQKFVEMYERSPEFRGEENLYVVLDDFERRISNMKDLIHHWWPNGIVEFVKDNWWPIVNKAWGLEKGQIKEEAAKMLISLGLFSGSVDLSVKTTAYSARGMTVQVSENEAYKDVFVASATNMLGEALNFAERVMREKNNSESMGVIWNELFERLAFENGKGKIVVLVPDALAFLPAFYLMTQLVAAMYPPWGKDEMKKAWGMIHLVKTKDVDTHADLFDGEEATAVIMNEKIHTIRGIGDKGGILLDDKYLRPEVSQIKSALEKAKSVTLWDMSVGVIKPQRDENGKLIWPK